MSRERNPLCSRCGVRPRIQKQAYCRECRAALSLEWYHKKHPEAKWCDQTAAAEKRKQRAEEEARAAAVSSSWKHGAARRESANWLGG